MEAIKKGFLQQNNLTVRIVCDTVKEKEIKNMEELNVKETQELGVFEGSTSVPVIKMFNGEELSAAKMINIVNGSAKSVSDFLNQELTLLGFGGVVLDFVDDETGEMGRYNKYILITDKGEIATTSTFIGRTLKMLWQCNMTSPRIKFRQVEQSGRRRFLMDLLD